MPRPECLTLIGTVHRDPEGEGRLLRLLEELHPDGITLEMSSAALSYRRFQGKLLLQRLERILDRLAGASGLPRHSIDQHPAIASIRSLLALPFEYRGASAYSAVAKIPFDLIDQSDVSLMVLRQVERELITYRNLKTLLSLPVAEACPTAQGYATAHILLAKAPPQLLTSFLAGCRGAEGIGPRDQKLAEELRLRLRFLPGHLVHIGGWIHLLDDPQGETLYARLKDLSPCRHLLGDDSPLP